MKAGTKKYGNTLPALVVLITGLIAVTVSGYISPSNQIGGNISISVKYKGTPPAVSAYKVTKDQNVCSHQVPNETLIIGKDKGIKNVMGYLKGASGKAPLKDYMLNNSSCKFVPHVGFAHKGSNLILKNNDNVVHNVHGYLVIGKLKKTIVNNALQKKGSTIKNSRVLSKPGLISVKCDAHEWMSATIIVVDNPYYGITDGSGKVIIKNVPTGTYNLVLYHSILGEITRKVTVSAGKTATVAVEMTK